jgi:hypothetical protein
MRVAISGCRVYRDSAAVHDVDGGDEQDEPHRAKEHVQICA